MQTPFNELRTISKSDTVGMPQQKHDLHAMKGLCNFKTRIRKEGKYNIFVNLLKGRHVLPKTEGLTKSQNI